MSSDVLQGQLITCEIEESRAGVEFLRCGISPSMTLREDYRTLDFCLPLVLLPRREQPREPFQLPRRRRRSSAPAMAWIACQDPYRRRGLPARDRQRRALRELVGEKAALSGGLRAGVCLSNCASSGARSSRPGLSSFHGHEIQHIAV